MPQRFYKSAVPAAYIPSRGKARILILDIETNPIQAAVWGLWDQNVGLSMIHNDWFILSFAAKWLGANRVIYHDQRAAPDVEDDTALLAKLWDLLDKADIVVAHNGKSFDVKKINARFIANGFKPPSPFKVVDTLLIAKAKFKFTSNKLEYIADKLNKVYKKLKHGEFPGYELWRQVRLGNRRAWQAMRKYNEYDVLSLEELYYTLRAWDDKHPNVNVQAGEETLRCPTCGSDHVEKRGSSYTSVGRYQRYVCLEAGCGAWSRGRTLLNTKDQRKALLSK